MIPPGDGRIQMLNFTGDSGRRLRSRLPARRSWGI